MSYIYMRTEPGLWTVGFYHLDNQWEPDSDHSSPEEAARRVAWLNGSPSDHHLLVAERDELKAEVTRRRTEDLELRGLLSPQGTLLPPVPAEQIDAGVAPAVQWLIAEVKRIRRGHVCTERCRPNSHVAFTGRRRLDELETENDRLRAEVERLTARADAARSFAKQYAEPDALVPIEMTHLAGRVLSALDGRDYDTDPWTPAPAEPDPDTTIQEDTTVNHRAILSRAHRHLIATGWRGDSTTPMGDSTDYVLRRPGGRIEAHVRHTGKLMAVTLAGLSPEQITDLAQAIVQDGPQA